MLTFSTMFPLSIALDLKPVPAGAPGFDSDQVAEKLGPERFQSLMNKIAAESSVFCCNHRSWPADHPDEAKRGAEVYCIYAQDLEAFLKGGG